MSFQIVLPMFVQANYFPAHVFCSQMELKKAREAEEKQKILEEEQKLERRIQEQQERMRLEFEEEQAKKKAKEDAVRYFVTSLMMSHFKLWNVNMWQWLL